MVNDSNAELLPMKKEQNFNGAHLLLISASNTQSTGRSVSRSAMPSIEESLSNHPSIKEASFYLAVMHRFVSTYSHVLMYPTLYLLGPQLLSFFITV